MSETEAVKTVAQQATEWLEQSRAQRARLVARPAPAARTVSFQEWAAERAAFYGGLR